MRNSIAAVRVQRPLSPGDREGLRPGSYRTGAIDTRLVRAELARLRGPQPATRVYSARMIRSTISRAS
jgi:hypothetical protein